ncbi:MAG: hypothetical protein D6719_03800 [Candidatus Dadabacteria bacterium]|nr:MAG: hypothetical protein D6719_03800 [Candidatus Dadabacteria bacterium]
MKELQLVKIFFAATLCFLLIYVFWQRGNYSLKKSFAGSDIEAIWQEGDRICHLKNPYSRIHVEGSGIKKPPVYLPGFYLGSCLISKALGINTFREWIKLWTVANTALGLILGLILFLYGLYSGRFVPACIVLVLWTLGRWSLHSLASNQINMPALIPFALALMLYKRNQTISLLLLGLSLSIKQIAVFTAPVFVLYGLSTLKDSYKDSLKKAFRRAFYIIIIPLLITLPFLVDDFSGVLLSISYSAERASDLKALRVAETTGISPALQSMLMYFTMLLVYLDSLKGRYSLSALVSLVMLVFVTLNRVVFTQYLLWALLPLAVLYLSDAKDSRTEVKP